MDRKLAIGFAFVVGICGCKTVQEPSVNENAGNGAAAESPDLQPEASQKDVTEAHPKDSVPDASGAKTEPETKPEPEAETEPEEPEPPTIDVPEGGWAWEKLTDACDYVSPEWPYDELDYLLEQDGDGGTECRDGKTYCYGPDNTPIVRPESEGWTCRYVAKMPSKYYKPNSYEYFVWRKGAWYYEDNHRARQLFAKGALLKTWLCEDDSCECGKTSCPRDAACIEGKCFCNDKSIASSGHCKLDTVKPRNKDDQDTIKQRSSLKGLKMDEDDENIYYTSMKTNDDDEQMRYCGKFLLTDHEVQHCVTLVDGKIAVFFEPANLRERFDNGADDENDKYLMDLEAEKKFCESYCEDMNCSEEDSLCVNGLLRRRDIEAERNSNIDNPSYQCGKETCVNGEICLDNHCVGLSTHQKLPEGYTWSAFMPSCHKEDGCACGAEKCKFGQYCYERKCTQTPFVQKYKGKLIHYGAMTNGYEDAVHYDHILPPKDDIWFDILTDSDSLACDNATMPANVGDYQCVFERLRDDRGESPQQVVTAKGYYCAQEKGCACGGGSCPMHTRCLQGKCLYDGIYMTLACHYDSNMVKNVQDVNSVLHYLDERGWCHCGASFVPPNLPGYECDGSGMLCMQKEGCACGKVKCNKNQYCLKPGECK